MTALSASTRTLANHIGGAWTPSAAIETLPDRDPATGELLAEVPLSTAADVDAAVRAARTAQREWRATSPLVRAHAVMKLRAVLDAHRDELAELVTGDMGKTLDDAAVEVGRGIEVEAGMVGANVGVPAPIAWFPFSGWKDSIDGGLRANGRDSVEFYTRKTVVTARWAA